MMFVMMVFVLMLVGMFVTMTVVYLDRIQVRNFGYEWWELHKVWSLISDG